jgi:hypothetical protein
VNGKRNGKKPCLSGRLTSCLIAKVARSVARHFSDIVCESLRQPGSWRCLELVYRNEPRKMLDRFFLSSRSAGGARNRLQIMQEELCKCIEQYSSLHNPIRLTSFGSGPGHEILGCMDKSGDKIAIEATCIDREPGALEHGRLMAAEKGLSEYVKYVQGNVLRMNEIVAKYDIGILSGLLDYFDFETAVSVLRMVRDQLLPGGTVLIANMRRHYLASTMSILGDWHLVYREPEEIERILVESGFEEVEVWLEPEQIFCLGKARKSR